MSAHRPPDAVPGIVASGREITRDDVEMLWSGLISGHYTWQQTSDRALALIETVNGRGGWTDARLYRCRRSFVAVYRAKTIGFSCRMDADHGRASVPKRGSADQLDAGRSAGCRGMGARFT